MGFGSYDESEQENQEIDTDIEESDRSTLAEHDGEVEFEYDDASSEDLLETFEEIQGQ
ncbi:death domain-associated protein [Halobacteriales archaeon QH_10_70_21]|nr:MAG: death domain-associated protein [Halobacteriales archaeon QH_10_70_21]